MIKNLSEHNSTTLKHFMFFSFCLFSFFFFLHIFPYFVSVFCFSLFLMLFHFIISFSSFFLPLSYTSSPFSFLFWSYIFISNFSLYSFIFPHRSPFCSLSLLFLPYALNTFLFHFRISLMSNKTWWKAWNNFSTFIQEIADHPMNLKSKFETLISTNK